MDCIVCRKFHGIDGMGKERNFKRGTRCQDNNHSVYYKGEYICFDTSKTYTDNFARNDDGKGYVRFEKAHRIIRILQNTDSYQQRWDLVWKDEVCLRYKKHDAADFWHWDASFYNADIEDLDHILNLVRSI